MELQLEGKRALVTGSSPGIGEAIAKALAGEGVIAAVHGRRPEEVARVVAEIEAGGGPSVAVVGDLTVAQNCDGVAEQVAAVLGGLDILVNNAGQLPANNLERDRSRAVEQTHEANVVSVVRLLKRFLPGMIEQRYGRLIQIASDEAEAPRRGWGDSWKEIEAGVTRDWLRNYSGRLGRPDDVAPIVCLLRSPSPATSPAPTTASTAAARRRSTDRGSRRIPRRLAQKRRLRKDGPAVSAPRFGPMTLER
jgi:hypothetical protein